ncbi:MAG: hypothetical protein H7Y43_08020 [Akkermansiaceae bacterium]|nr:hypothetical protein [Verrucomicrobiales bacterium]
MRLKLNKKNYRRICGLNGLLPAEVPTRIGRTKVTVYRALKNPRQFTPTLRLLEQALPIREVVNGQKTT